MNFVFYSIDISKIFHYSLIFPWNFSGKYSDNQKTVEKLDDIKAMIKWIWYLGLFTLRSLCVSRLWDYFKS